ncbi:MAG: hypothetical protein ACFB9N_16300 [Geitlerinemataceae cyanobacterium]
MKIFLSDELDISLESLASESDGLEVATFRLIESAIAQGFADQLYVCFCESRPHLRFDLVENLDSGKREANLQDRLGLLLMKVFSNIPFAKRRRKMIYFKLEGKLEETQINNAILRKWEEELREISGDFSIKIVEVEEGSIKLKLSISPEGLEALKEAIQSGLLTQIGGIPISDSETISDARISSYHGADEDDIDAGRMREIRSVKRLLTQSRLGERKLKSSNLDVLVLPHELVDTNLQKYAISEFKPPSPPLAKEPPRWPVIIFFLLLIFAIPNVSISISFRERCVGSLCALIPEE